MAHQVIVLAHMASTQLFVDGYRRALNFHGWPSGQAAARHRRDLLRVIIVIPKQADAADGFLVADGGVRRLAS